MNQHHLSKFFAGSAAGITAVLLTYPLDTIRARLAFQVTGEHIYSGIANAAATMCKNVSDEHQKYNLLNSGVPKTIFYLFIRKEVSKLFTEALLQLVIII